VFFAAAVGLGVTGAGDPIPITYKTDRYVMATGPFNFGASSLILDLKTRKAIYSYTGKGTRHRRSFNPVQLPLAIFEGHRSCCARLERSSLRLFLC